MVPLKRYDCNDQLQNVRKFDCISHISPKRELGFQFHYMRNK